MFRPSYEQKVRSGILCQLAVPHQWVDGEDVFISIRSRYKAVASHEFKSLIRDMEKDGLLAVDEYIMAQRKYYRYSLTLNGAMTLRNRNSERMRKIRRELEERDAMHKILLIRLRDLRRSPLHNVDESEKKKRQTSKNKVET